MGNKYDLRSGMALYNAIVGPLVGYAGIITGVSGVVDDFDPTKMALGGTIYFVAKGISIANQYRIDSDRAEKLEKMLKGETKEK